MFYLRTSPSPGAPDSKRFVAWGSHITSDLGPGNAISQGAPYRASGGGDGLLRVTCPPDTLLRGASYFETVPLVWGGSLRLAPNIHTSGRFDDVYTGGTNFEVCV